MLQVAQYVRRELLHRTVAARRIAMHGFENDSVQIALQRRPADGGRRFGIAVADLAVEFAQIITGEAVGALTR